MTQFLSEELDNEMYDLIDRVNDLHDILEDARRAKNFEAFDDFMATAYECAGSMQYDIDALRYEGSELHSEKE